MRIAPSARPLPIQIAVLIAGAALLAMLPPARGVMLLVPVLSSDIAVPIRTAVAHGAAIIATGPVPGSILVYGDRARLAALWRSHRILLLAAPAAGCGRFLPGAGR